MSEPRRLSRKWQRAQDKLFEILQAQDDWIDNRTMSKMAKVDPKFAGLVLRRFVNDGTLLRRCKTVRQHNHAGTRTMYFLPQGQAPPAL